MNWQEKKQSVIDNLVRADIDPQSKMGKAILKLERTSLSAWNAYNLRGQSIESITNSGLYDRLHDAIEKVNGYLYGHQDITKAINIPQWKRYCEFTGMDWKAEAGDYLA